jgi:hypothetical protein
MIYFVRFKDIPQFLVGGAISIGFFAILIPVWIANPRTVGSPGAALIQLGLIVVISMKAAGALCRWLKQQARLENAAPPTIKKRTEPHNPSALSSASSASHSKTARDTIKRPASRLPDATEIQTVQAAAEEIAWLIGNAFLSNRFTEIFADQSFSDGWTVGDGLAVWYFFGTVSLDVAVLSTITLKDDALPIIDLCHSLLSKRWRMPSAVLERFNAVRQEYAHSALIACGDCKSAGDFISFFSRFANFIIGADLPANHPFAGLTGDAIRRGYVPKTLDPALGTAIAEVFFDTTDAVKKLLR